jgi:hypothetical protein
MPEEAQRALTGIEVEELFDFDHGSKVHTGRLRKVKFGDKMAALQFLGKYLGMTHDRVEVTGKGGGPITIVAVRDLIRDLLLRADKPIDIAAKPVGEQDDG